MPTKEQFEQTILDINGSTCDQFKKMVTLSKLISEVYGEIYNNDGDLDPNGAFLKAICSNLDCDGNGPVGSTTSTTAAPVATDEVDLFLFRTELDAPSLKSVMLQMNGSQFDSNETINAADITDIPSNKVIQAAAIQPGTGDLYVIHTSGVSGESGSDLDLVLATCDKTTGVLTDVATLTIGGVNQNYSSSYGVTGVPLGMDFKRDDGTLYVTTPGNGLYTMDPTNAVMTLVGVIGLPTGSDNKLTSYLSFDHDGTLFSVGSPQGSSSSHLLRTISLTTDPTYPLYVAISSVCGGGVGGAILEAAGNQSKGHPLIIRRNNLYVLDTKSSGGQFYSLGKTPEDALGGSTVCSPPTQLGTYDTKFAQVNAVAYQAT